MVSNVADKLWLPGERRWEQCLICGAKYPMDNPKEMENHVIKCSEEHREVVESMHPQYALKELYAVGDHDLDAWVKKNRTAILEGRKRM